MNIKYFLIAFAPTKKYQGHKTSELPCLYLVAKKEWRKYASPQFRYFLPFLKSKAANWGKVMCFIYTIPQFVILLGPPPLNRLRFHTANAFPTQSYFTSFSSSGCCECSISAAFPPGKEMECITINIVLEKVSVQWFRISFFWKIEVYRWKGAFWIVKPRRAAQICTVMNFAYYRKVHHWTRGREGHLNLKYSECTKFWPYV